MEATFFLATNRTRATQFARMATALGATKRGKTPKDKRLVGTFLPSADEPYFAHVHIDTYPGEPKKKIPADYQVSLALRPLPDNDPPAALTKSELRLDWLFTELKRLAGREKTLDLFVEAHVRIPDLTTPPILVAPLTVGATPLPIKGMEFGSDEIIPGVYAFRWRRESAGLTIHVSYTKEIDTAILSEVWTDEGKAAWKHVQEGLGT